MTLLLAFVVRALPWHRREWGRAMAAELATITGRRDRVRFVAGCARVAVVNWPVVVGVVGVVAFVVVVIGAMAGIPSTGVRVEAGVLAGAIVVLAWRGRRPGAISPVDAHLAARSTRLGGYAVVMATVAALLTMGTNDPKGWWLAAVAVGLYLASFLRLTAYPGALSLPLAAGLTVAGLATWWTLMLVFQGVRDVPFVAFLIALVVVAAGAARRSSAGLFSGLVAAAAMLLLTFLAATLTYRLAPDLAPDISPPGLDPVARAENNRVESVDPYVADFLFGAMLLTVVAACAGREVERSA